MARTVTKWDASKWLSAIIGAPYREGGREIDGPDCWGVVYLGFRDCLGIELPSPFAGLDDAEEVIQSGKSEWTSVDLKDVKPFDVIEMRGIYRSYDARRRHGRIHCGLVHPWPYPEKRVLHCERGAGVVSVPLSSLANREPKAFRHRSQL